MGEPAILIGIDNAFLLSKSEISKNGPTISFSKLGNIIHGPVEEEEKNVGIVASVVESEELHQLVKSYFTTEEFGVRATKTRHSKDNERALQIMESTTKRVEGGWETGLLWKDEFPQLPSSREGALQRWRSMERKMKRNPEFEHKYEEKIAEYKSKGFVRRVTEDDVPVAGKLWYLPHFHAMNPKKPEKIRLVFDAAAIINGTCLNDNLLQGPDFYISLPKILLKFRQFRVAFSGDIKDMFHRVKIISTDLQAQRFLYRNEEDQEQESEFLMSVMIFGAKCSPSSAQFVKNKNASEFEQEFPDAVRAIVENHYVDDYLDSVDSIDLAKKRISEVSKIHSQGGFTICNWLSSHEEALLDVPAELRSKKKENKIKEESERVLGLYWRASEDIFTYPDSFSTLDENIISGVKIPTKREVLKVLMTVFDPLGLLAHFTIGAKIILQDIWRSGIDWNSEILPEQHVKWKNWVKYLPKLKNLNLPRCYEADVKLARKIQLHVFVDASQVAFCAVVYLRFEFSAKVKTALVMGKTRVAPIKTLTVPRLELQAAVLGVRLAATVREALEFDISETYFWSDSMTVLKWLRADPSKFKTFIAVRIGEILEASEEKQWNWVPTKQNVADEATRGTWDFEFEKEARWYVGPEFLKEQEDKWPKIEESKLVHHDEVELKEVKAIKEEVPLINYNRFSKWSKLLRVVAYVLRFCVKREVRESGELKLSEVERAELVLWQLVQQECFADEIKSYEKTSHIDPQSPIFQLSPHFLKNEKVLRMRGRLAKASYLPLDVRFPIIVDPSHQVSRLLIHHYHEKQNHQGLESTLVELRQKYWVIKGRLSVRKVSNECLRCQLAKPRVVVQEMGELPKCRTEQPSRAFTYVGLDYFGPVEVVIGRRREKRWVALFTCLSVRAVHLELVHSLSTDSTIMAIRRFSARRGPPVEIHSDNGTNFVGAKAELRNMLEEFNVKKLENSCVSLGITWKFIPHGAPHMGGAWESLVKSVKAALGSILYSQALQEELLVTVLAEAERVVNSRPITYVSEDPNDPECLTPNHFIMGCSIENFEMGEFQSADMHLRKQWKKSQILANSFWLRWVREYLTSLNKRAKWHREGHQLKVGEIVFITDENQPKGMWAKGMVEEVYPGADGNIRVVSIRTSKGTYKRAVNKVVVPASQHANEYLDRSSNTGGGMLLEPDDKS